jgi:ribonuclease R
MRYGWKYPPERFSPEVLSEVKTFSLNDTIMSWRVEVPGFTIDGDFSKDLDDAIWLEKVGKEYILYVTLSDVGSLVQPGTQVFDEATHRYFTRYLREKNIPMIPHFLSENLLSLVEWELRPGITVKIPLDSHLQLGKIEVFLSKIRSEKRLSYRQADNAITDTSHPLNAQLKECMALTQRLLKHRRDNGALAFYDLVNGIATSEEWNIQLIKQEHHHIANIIIQECMILANMAMAKFCIENDITVLFRNHTPKKIIPPREQMVNDIELLIWQWGDVHSRIATTIERFSIMLWRATLGTQLEWHYGLNLPYYLWFTSGIRRVVDLLIQLNVRAHLLWQPWLDVSQMDMYGKRVMDETILVAEGASNYFKARDMWRHIVTAAKTRNFSRFDSPTFTKLIRVSAENWDIKPELQEEILDRQQKDTLIALDYYYIFLVLKSSTEELKDFQKIVFKGFQHTPHHAVSIFQLASQITQWEIPKHQTSEDTSKQVPIFSSQLLITINWQQYRSMMVSVPSKKWALQLAHIHLLGKILGFEDIFSILPQNILWVTQPPDKTQWPVENKVWELLEFCQGKKIPTPEFHFKSEWPPNLSTHFAIWSIKIWTDIFTTKWINSWATRWEAKQKAAWELLSLLVEKYKTPPEKTSTTNAQIASLDLSQNAKSLLNSLCQKQWWKPPIYTLKNHWSDNLPEFIATVSIITEVEPYSIQWATWKTKKEAQHYAAKALLEKLQRDWILS